MEETRDLLKQIGWSDELIEACTQQSNFPAYKLIDTQYILPATSVQDVTNISVSIDTPTISDGAHLYS